MLLPYYSVEKADKWKRHTVQTINNISPGVNCCWRCNFHMVYVGVGVYRHTCARTYGSKKGWSLFWVVGHYKVQTKALRLQNPCAPQSKPRSPLCTQHKIRKIEGAWKIWIKWWYFWIWLSMTLPMHMHYRWWQWLMNLITWDCISSNTDELHVDELTWISRVLIMTALELVTPNLLAAPE